MNGKHDATNMTAVDGTIVEIDNDLVPLMTLLWERGLATRFSCQGEPYFVDQTEWDGKRHRAYIMFEMSATLLMFLSDLIKDFPVFRSEKMSWTIEFDRAPNWRTVGQRDEPEGNRVTIRFPHQDIKTLIYYLEMQKELDTFVSNISFLDHPKENHS